MTDKPFDSKKQVEELDSAFKRMDQAAAEERHKKYVAEGKCSPDVEPFLAMVQANDPEVMDQVRGSILEHGLDPDSKRTIQFSLMAGTSKDTPDQFTIIGNASKSFVEFLVRCQRIYADNPTVVKMMDDPNALGNALKNALSKARKPTPKPSAGDKSVFDFLKGE